MVFKDKNVRDVKKVYPRQGLFKEKKALPRKAVMLGERGEFLLVKLGS
jgi:hypothetical protein